MSSLPYDNNESSRVNIATTNTNTNTTNNNNNINNTSNNKNDNDNKNENEIENENENNKSIIDVFSVGFASDDVVFNNRESSAKKKTTKKKKNNNNKKKNNSSTVADTNIKLFRPYISISSSEEEEVGEEEEGAEDDDVEAEAEDDVEGSDSKVTVLPELPNNENVDNNSNTMIGNININNNNGSSRSSSSSSSSSVIIGNGNGNGNIGVYGSNSNSNSNSNSSTYNNSNSNNNRSIIFKDNIYDNSKDKDKDRNNDGIANDNNSVESDNNDISTRCVSSSNQNNNNTNYYSTRTSTNSNITSSMFSINNNNSMSNIINTANNNTVDNNTKISTTLYPADTYSILALHGPIESPGYFLFGLMVYLFQISFLLLMVFSKVHPIWSNNGDLDNPDAGRGSIVQRLALFIPANASPLVQATQIMATLTYIVFADSTIHDVVLGVELFPRFKQATSNDKIGCMVFSSILRSTQGILAIIVTLFLVVTTSNVIDIILNFTAINFISTLDNVGFQIIKWGKYGPVFEAEANRIESLHLPRCIYRKYKHVRYWCAVIPIGVILLACLFSITILQENNDVWVTKIFRVQFQDKEQGLQVYNGCYEKNEYAIDRMNGFRRKFYEGYEDNSASAKFGYCMAENRWMLFKGDTTSACEAGENGNELARSSKTYTFDVSTMFEEAWYSSSNTPLDVYFVEDSESSSNAVVLNETTCSSFLNDGNCDSFFNKFDFQYDGGDCCAASCFGSDCGTGSLKNAFGTNIKTGDGFSDCDDPVMVPITIRLDNVLSSREPQFINRYNIPDGFNENSTIDEIIAEQNIYPHQRDFFAKEPVKPLLFIDCDGSNVLNIYVEKSMEYQTETIKVSDGADCTITIRNVTDGYDPIWYVNYTVFHGDKQSVESNPIVILQDSSNEGSNSNFKRIPDCFFDKLSDHIDNSTVYTGINDDATSKAIDWLMNDESEQSLCGDSFFLERYALAVISFATISASSDNTTFISKTRQCIWPSIICDNGAVFELDLGGELFSGYIPSEVGLLTSLKKLNLSYNQLTSSIPSEIGMLNSLELLDLDYNQLTGFIPSEIGLMTSIEYFDLNHNELIGLIPSEIGLLKLLEYLYLNSNELIGFIPSEIGLLTSLKNLLLDHNELIGLIPSEIGLLTLLEYLYLNSNELIGFIPSEIGLLTSLKNLTLDHNYLTGSLPSEVMKLPSFDPLYVGQQKCMLCNGTGNNKKSDIEFTIAGNYSCSTLLLELEDIYSQNMTSLDKCEALKNECIICDYEVTPTDNNNTYTNATTTFSEVVNLVKKDLYNETDKFGS